MDESKRQLWEERFEEQANSGMTVDAWCTSKQLETYGACETSEKRP